MTLEGGEAVEVLGPLERERGVLVFRLRDGSLGSVRQASLVEAWPVVTVSGTVSRSELARRPGQPLVVYTNADLPRVPERAAARVAFGRSRAGTPRAPAREPSTQRRGPVRRADPRTVGPRLRELERRWVDLERERLGPRRPNRPPPVNRVNRLGDRPSLRERQIRARQADLERRISSLEERRQRSP